MKVLPLFLVLCLSASSLASDLEPGWGVGWSAGVWNTYCELQRRYVIPFPADSKRRGFLSETAFNAAFVRFATTTRTHGNLITPDQLDILQFSLYVYPEALPVSDNQRILSANLGGFEVQAHSFPNTGIHIFSASEDESNVLLQRFVNNETVTFELRFADGKTAQFSIRDAGDRNFHVWEAMFQTCVRRNRN
jgi:hypothetical protein